MYPCLGVSDYLYPAELLKTGNKRPPFSGETVTKCRLAVKEKRIVTNVDRDPTI